LLLKHPQTSSIWLSISAAARWIAPIKAPFPPPIMPILSFRFIMIVLLSWFVTKIVKYPVYAESVPERAA